MKTFSTKCRKSLITLACVIAAIALVAVPQNVSAKKKKIGIQLYSVMDAMNKNPQKSIERLAAMGYNSAELVQWGGDPKVFGMPADEFKKLCDANSMKIVSTHSSIQEDKNKEEEIMNHYWSRGDMQIRELQSCYDDPKPHVNTLSTLVRILEEKGFLSHRALSARCFQYFATVSRDEYSRGSLKNVISKFFGNSYLDAVSSLVKEEDLTVEDLKKLIDMVKDK